VVLDFYVYVDLFMNFIVQLVDIMLPVVLSFECEVLKIGFEISLEVQFFV